MATSGVQQHRIVTHVDRLVLGYRDRVIVRDLSFDVRTGDILGIVGPNGCGKTTLLRTILGLLKPLAGRVERDEALTVSYIPQRDKLETLLPFTAFEVVLMGRMAHRRLFQCIRSVDLDAVRQALVTLEIDQIASCLFRNLSGGQQQRVLLARAVAADPDVLVLDEPTAGMDVASESAILAFLHNLNRTRRVTILIVTHLLSLVLNFATTVLLIDAERTFYGRVDDVLREDRLSALYGVPIHLGCVAGQRILTVGHQEPRHV